MKRTKKRSHSVYRMLVLSYVVMLAVSLLFAGFGYKRLYEDARTNTENRISSQLAQSAYVVDGYVESMRQSVNAIAMSTFLQSFVYTRYPMDADDYYALVETVNEVRNVRVSNNNIYKIALYVKGIDSLVSSTTRMSTEDYFKAFLNFNDMTYEEWKDEISAPIYFTTLPARRSGNGTSLIGFVQSMPITDIPGRGAAVAYMDAGLISDVMESGGLLDSGSLLIEDGTRRILTIGDESISSRWQQDESGEFSLDMLGKSHLTVSVKGKSGWTYHCAISSSVYVEELRYTQSFIMKMLLIELVGGILLAIVVSYVNYSPLRRLVKTVTGNQAEIRRCNEYEAILNTTADILNHNSALTDRLKMQEPMIRSSLLHKLLTKNHAITVKLLEEFGISFAEGGLSVLLIAIPAMESDENSALMSYSLISILEDRFRDGVNACTLEYASDTVAVILSGSEEKIHAFAYEAAEYIESRISAMPIVCTGSVVSGIDELYISVTNAQEAMDYAVAWNKTGVTRYEDMKFEAGVCILEAACEQELSICLRAGDDKGASELVRKLFDNAKSEPLMHVRLLTYGLITAFLRVLSEWKIHLPLQEEIEKLSADMEGDISPSGILEKLEAYAVEIAGYAQKFKSGSFDDVSNKVMEIIRSDYADSALSLTVISQKLDMNSSYLSHVFKQQSGKSFIDALNGTRMENARALLRTTDLTVQEIAEKCGYTSASYFIRVFKKQCGQTPVQYKTEIGSRNG